MEQVEKGLISGKEALIALANGEEVIYINNYYKDRPLKLWGDAKECNIEQFLSGDWIFLLKSRTITINGIEVPAPFEPKNGDTVFVLANFLQQGYSEYTYPTFEGHVFQFGAWRTEEEIRQVVATLHKVFGG